MIGFALFPIAPSPIIKLDLPGNNQLLAGLYQELVEHLTDKQDWRYTASLTSLGDAYNSPGRCEEAISLYQQSREICREIGNKEILPPLLSII